jgi:Mrp family chromosome partitioning ATPase
MDISAFYGKSEEELQAELERLQAEDAAEGYCSGNCSNCSSDCGDSKVTPRKAKKIIAVYSGKGGTGKSVVTALLAGELARLGKRVAILDADLTNPTTHLLFNKQDPAGSDEKLVFTVKADNGVEFISMGNIHDKPDQPLLWYGKDIATGVLYFYTDVKWDDPDVLLVDMPTGIGDVPLQAYTVIPFDGAICVSTPSNISDYMARKSTNLLKMVMIPVLGLVENMVSEASQDVEEHAKALELELLAQVQYDPMLALAADFGKLAEVQAPALVPVAERIVKLLG